MAERYPGKRSEYGGGDGAVDRLADGTSIDLPSVPSRTGDRARLMRQAGMHDFDPSASDDVGVYEALGGANADTAGMSDAVYEQYLIDKAASAERAAERQRLSDRTNGYILEPDQYVGEGGEGNGVAGFN